MTLSELKQIIQNIQRYVTNEAGSANLPGKENGPQDAYRHLLLSAELTRVFGKPIADLILVSHELENLIKDGQPTTSSVMDLNNNNVGMDEIAPYAQSWDDVVTAAREKINQSMNGSGESDPNGPVVWLDTQEWSDAGSINQTPYSERNWPTNPLVTSSPIWPDTSYPLPSDIPSPSPPGNNPFFTGLDHVFSDSLGALLGIGNLNEWEKHIKELFPIIQTLNDLGHYIGQNLPTPHEIDQLINDFFLSARNWILQLRDPLTLDLDDDGLETVGIDAANPILFDHDGDGVANATGWIKPDDGFLVLDRNGNGVIDNGAELFGDSTPLVAGGTAADGFAALAQEDTNGDGLVNADDAHWNDLRVWRDLNSDGISQEGELFTLEALGIAGIHVAKSENTTRLANGNQIADLGSYIRDDGTEGTVGQVTGALADIDLVDNPFYREFSDTVPLTEQAQALPDMQGSGRVRDLCEVANDHVYWIRRMA